MTTSLSARVRFLISIHRRLQQKFKLEQLGKPRKGNNIFKSPETIKPFACLPVELVRLIFEAAASQYKLAGVSLLCVSKTVQRWIYPIMFRRVVLHSTRQAQNFLCTLQLYDKHAGANVRCLIFILPLENHGVRLLPPGILASCPQMEILATNTILPQMYQFYDGLFITNNCPSPWEVTLLCQTLPRHLDSNHPLFKNLTHFFVASGDWSKERVQKVLSFPRLTHLALAVGPWDRGYSVEHYSSLVNHILSSSSLSCLLLHTSHTPECPVEELIGEEWWRLAEISDKRLLAAPGMQHAKYGELVESGGSIWEDVETKYKNWRRLVRRY
ncbi:hypothetical protein K439DRAFT_206595 [Ramaria rubella]|nr:hypothetical protein K439DRAFT_206595 [Ramaria rubella]